ncbi:hypothetical protein VTO73DRAFT_1441 [Trametes versicolor]
MFAAQRWDMCSHIFEGSRSIQTGNQPSTTTMPCRGYEYTGRAPPSVCYICVDTAPISHRIPVNTFSSR